MNISKYCKIYPSGKNLHNVILYSTKNAAMAGMPKAMAEALPYAEMSGEDRKTLRKLGFLVNDPEKERKEMLGYIDELNGLDNSLNIKLVMNLDCNLACRYCFEGVRKGRFYMTKQTADDFVEFVKTIINSQKKAFPPGRSVIPTCSVVATLSEDSHRESFLMTACNQEGCRTSRHDKKNRVFKKTAMSAIEEILIIFYGGEPLMSRDLIIYISAKLKSFAKDRGIRFRSYLVTNGTLLTKETVKMLKPLGLKEAYITIDGPKDIHDSFRPYKTAKGSFETIIRNVKDICNMIDVRLGGNFLRDNFERFPELLDYLFDNGLKPPVIPAVQFFPVVAESAGFGPPDFNEGCASVNEPWLFEASLFLREEILKRGFRLGRTAPGLCMMEYENSILVNHDGSIHKCPGLIGREEFRIGDIWRGTKDYRKSHCLDNWKNDECLDCAYLPLCFGGCRYMKLMRDGDMNGVDCKRPYFDAALETLIDQDIRYGLIAG
ncbi:MAG: geopeptide radical SAM maturase [Nitrospirota bacterium]